MSDEIVENYINFLKDRKTKTYSLVLYPDKGNDKFEPIQIENIRNKLEIKKELDLENVVQTDQYSNDKLLISN